MIVSSINDCSNRVIWNSIASVNRNHNEKRKSIQPPWPMNYKFRFTQCFPPSWAPSGTRIACRSNISNIVVHDQRHGPFDEPFNDRVTGWYADRVITVLKFSPDGRFLVSADNKCVITLWDNVARSHEQLQKWNIKETTDGQNDNCCIGVSPCSKYIIVAPRLSNQIFLKSVENGGEIINTLTPQPVMTRINQTLFSFDGHAIFVSIWENRISVINLWLPYLDDANEDSLISIWRQTDGDYSIARLALSHDNTMIAIDNYGGAKKLLSIDIDNDHNCRTQELHFPGNERLSILYITPDDKCIVYSTTNELKYWSIAGRNLLIQNIFHIKEMSWKILRR